MEARFFERYLKPIIESLICAAIISILNYIASVVFDLNEVAKNVIILISVSVFALVLIYGIFTRKQKILLGKVKRAGIREIAFSRDELDKLSSIEDVINSIKKNTELLIVARSAIVWANKWQSLLRRINADNITISFLLPDPSIQTSDWAHPGLCGCLQMIKQHLNHKNVSVFYLREYFPFSIVHFIDDKGSKNCILELGGNIPTEERFVMILKGKDEASSQTIERLRTVHEGYKTNKVDISKISIPTSGTV